MRVAFLTYNAHAGDAIGNQLAEKVSFFLDRGADVRVFVENGQRIHTSLQPHCRFLDIQSVEGEGWNFLATADLVLAEYGQAYSLLQVLPLLAKASGPRPRVVFDYHGVTPPELWGTHNREAVVAGARQRGLVWCADAALVHSRFTRDELHQHTAFPADRVFWLGYPLDTRQFQPGEPRQDLRDALGIGPSALLLFVGRVAPNKQVPLLVEALALLKERTPAVHAVIVGDTTDAYEEETRRCQERAVARGVGNRLHVLGRLDAEQLRDAYRSADVFVTPSQHEGFCLPVLEAMAIGLPVVASRSTALPETVARAGLTFTPGDAVDLVREVEHVLDGSRAFTGNLRRRGLERAALFSRERWRRRFADVVEWILDLPARPYREDVEVEPRSETCTVSAGLEALLVSVQVHNRGTHALLSDGPARNAVRCEVADDVGNSCATPCEATPLPALLMPGQTLVTTVPVPVPPNPGIYRVTFHAGRREGAGLASGSRRKGVLTLEVAESVAVSLIRATLVEAERLQRLPADYTDVTEGWLASWKRWLKRKVLGNFKHAYVDVLSRQQSDFNQRILTILNEMALPLDRTRTIKSSLDFEDAAVASVALAPRPRPPHASRGRGQGEGDPVDARRESA